jgi:two-component system probable response regulator PhcQ
MLNDQARNKCGVLYIDDEEMALKYFRRALADRFEVFTASSAREGLEVLRREADRIGIILSDQRMPETLGAEVLAAIREEFPSKVRILTTAYSDLKSAIDAVNKGHIYQYVTKPWDTDQLIMVLQRAADYYAVLTERNELLALKMTTLQRLICGDRLKWLLLLEPTWTDPIVFRRALSALVAAMPETLESRSPVGRGGFSRADFDIEALVRGEYETGRDSIVALREAPSAEIPADLPPHLREPLQALTDPLLAGALGKFFAELIHNAGMTDAQIAFEAAPAPCIGLRAVAPDPVLRACFGLFVEKRISSAALAFVHVLLALQQGGGAALIVDAQEFQLEFVAGEESPGEILDALYKKFANWDIFRL